MGGNLKVWVFKFRGKIFGGNTTVYISSGETNTVYRREQGLISVAHKLKPHLLTSPMYGKFTIFTYFSIQLEKGHPFEESAKWSTVGMKLDSCQIVLKILYLLLLCERSTRNSFRQSFQTLSQNEAGHCARNFKLLRLLIWKWGNSFYQALGVQHNLNFLNMHIGSPILSC